MKTTDPEAFQYRVNYAVQCFLKNIKSRNFDNCFEMFDGDAVVVALMRRAFKNTKLKQAIVKNWRELGPLGFPLSWEETYLKYSHVRDVNALAKELRMKYKTG
jgi:hypothetical protein